VSATTPEATTDYSSSNRASRGPAPVPPALWRGLVLGALAGPILLVVADFATLFETRGPRYLHDVVGHRNHGFAMAVIGVVGVLLWGLAARSRSPVAWGALAALGVAAAIVALGVDLPDTTTSGTLPNFQSAHSSPQVGFYLETLGAALMLVGGVGAALLSAPARGGPRPTG
jgi:hypothetical protein